MLSSIILMHLLANHQISSRFVNRFHFNFPLTIACPSFLLDNNLFNSTLPGEGFRIVTPFFKVAFLYCCQNKISVICAKSNIYKEVRWTSLKPACVHLLPVIFISLLPHIPSFTRALQGCECCSVVRLWLTAPQQSSFPLGSSYFQIREAFRLAHRSLPTSFSETLFESFSVFLALSHPGPPFARHSKKY